MNFVNIVVGEGGIFINLLGIMLRIVFLFLIFFKGLRVILILGILELE